MRHTPSIVLGDLILSINKDILHWIIIFFQYILCMDLHEVIQPSLQSVKAFLTTNVIIVYQDKLFYVKQSDQFFKPGTYNSLHTRSLCPHATLLPTNVSVAWQHKQRLWSLTTRYSVSGKKPLLCTRRFRLVSTWRRFLQKRSRLPSEYDSKCHVYFSILVHANCEETKRIIKLPKRKEIRTISSTRLILCRKKLSKTSTRHKSRMAATNHYWPLLIYNHEEREMFEVWHYATNTTTLIADEGGIA